MTDLTTPAPPSPQYLARQAAQAAPASNMRALCEAFALTASLAMIACVAILFGA